jgi:hypothetical protein
MPTPILTPAFAGAVAARATPQAIKAPAAIFVIVFMTEVPSRFGEFESSNAFFVLLNIEKRSEPPPTWAFMLRSLHHKGQKLGEMGGFSPRGVWDAG